MGALSASKSRNLIGETISPNRSPEPLPDEGLSCDHAVADATQQPRKTGEVGWYVGHDAYSGGPQAFFSPWREARQLPDRVCRLVPVTVCEEWANVWPDAMPAGLDVHSVSAWPNAFHMCNNSSGIASVAVPPLLFPAVLNKQPDELAPRYGGLRTYTGVRGVRNGFSQSNRIALIQLDEVRDGVEWHFASSKVFVQARAAQMQPHPVPIVLHGSRFGRRNSRCQLLFRDTGHTIVRARVETEGSTE